MIQTSSQHTEQTSTPSEACWLLNIASTNIILSTDIYTQLNQMMDSYTYSHTQTFTANIKQI